MRKPNSNEASISASALVSDDKSAEMKGSHLSTLAGRCPLYLPAAPFTARGEREVTLFVFVDNKKMIA